MKHPIKFALLLTLSCLFLLSCDEDNDTPLVIETPVQLPPLPDDAMPFLNVNVEGINYELMDGVDDATFYSSIVTVTENSIEVPQYGSSVTSDTSTLVFYLMYTRSSNTRNALVNELTKENGDIAFSKIRDGAVIEQQSGFLFEVLKLEYPQGPGFGFSTAYTDQPESTFFTIDNYYAGESNLTIWLEGRFSMKIDELDNGADIVEGSFLMEFPTCCFDG